MRFLKRLVLVVLPFVLCGSMLAQPNSGGEIVDSIEPDSMITLLQTCAKGPIPDRQITQTLLFPGGQFMLKELNTLGAVTADQYVEVIKGVCRGEIADIKPSEQTEHGRRGVELLKNEIAPALLWAAKNLDTLQTRLKQMRREPGIGRTAMVAEHNLPEKMILAPRYFYVMGGPVEAAAIDNQVYIDVLQNAWRSSRNLPILQPHDVLVFFADADHHVGYQKILNKKRDSLILSPAELQAWNFLANLMLQGSATFLNDSEGKPENLATIASVAPYQKDLPVLVEEAQRVLARTLKQMMNEKDFAKAIKPFAGNGYAATGAALLAAIQQKRGRDGVMEVMADPRKLLSAYNDSADTSTIKFQFNHDLAVRVQSMGTNTSQTMPSATPVP